MYTLQPPKTSPGRYQVPSLATSMRWPTTCGDTSEAHEWRVTKQLWQLL